MINRQENGAIQIVGLQEAEEKLIKLANTNVNGFNRGILKAGLFLQAKSQKLVPVDTGALKASAYTRINGGPEQPVGDQEIDPTSFAAKLWGGVKNIYNRVLGKKSKKQPTSQTTLTFEVGYTQNYAVHVHENLSAHHPVGQAKYLEEPARIHRAEMMQIVISEVLDSGKTV